MNPQGQAAIVTGGGSGLGAATAIRLAARGTRVALLDINLDAAKAVAAACGGLAIACDVGDADAMASALAQARAAHGPARMLVNCAGIGPAKRIVGRDGAMPLADFARVIQVNLIGTARVMEMMLTGRTYDATEGQALGISHYVVASGAGLAKGLELARRIAENEPLTNFAVMHVLPRIAEQDPASGYLMEALMAAIASGSPGAQRRLEDFLAKRAPKTVPR